MYNKEKFEELMMLEELSENTIFVYLKAVAQFFEKYKELNSKNYLSYKKLLQDKVKPKTVNIKISGINKYIDLLKIDCKKVKTIKIHKTTSVENVISKKEYEKLITKLKESCDFKGLLIVSILAKTGARVSEAQKITKKDIKDGFCEIYTKGKVRRIIIPKAVLEENACYLSEFKENELILINRYKNPITKKGIDGRLKNYAEKFGIKKDVMHAHSFRHFFAINFLKNGGNISLLSDILGHNSIATTAIYTRLSQEQQRNQLEKILNW